MDEVAIPSSNKRVSERWGASGSEAVGTGVWLLSGEAALTLLLVMPRPTAPAPATCCKVGLAPYYPPSAGVESHYPFVRCPKPYHRRTVGCSIATPPISIVRALAAFSTGHPHMSKDIKRYRALPPDSPPYAKESQSFACPEPEVCIGPSAAFRFGPRQGFFATRNDAW